MPKRCYRVEGSVPALQYVYAKDEEEAIKLAVEIAEWDVDLEADITEDHIEAVTLDDDDDAAEEANP